MAVGIIGTGWVGLVSGLCFAKWGNQVICCDIDESKIEPLNRGVAPFYEPDMQALLSDQLQHGNIAFTTDVSECIRESDVIVVCVATPSMPDGDVYLDSLYKVAAQIAEEINEHKTVVIKSTVPVGTSQAVAEILGQQKKHTFDVVSNPEFLREGKAILDMQQPDRVVIGAETTDIADRVAEIYKPISEQIVRSTNKTAELVKYASNAYLAMRISYINSIARLCDAYHIDICGLSEILGADHRIGCSYFDAGIGYGGSCLPKDLAGLTKMLKKNSVDASLFEAVKAVNDTQIAYFIDTVESVIGNLSGKQLTVWGLTFKESTDDIRESPAIQLVSELMDRGAKVICNDAVFAGDWERYEDKLDSIVPKNAIFERDIAESTRGSEAILIAVNSPHYGADAPWDRIGELVKNKAVFDGRNGALCVGGLMHKCGFKYYGIGRSFEE